MRNLITIIITSLFLLTNTACAESPKKTTAAEKPTIQRMNQRMGNMQAEMEKIKKTKDPKKKQALLEEHMKNMQNQMNMMGEMMNNKGMMGGNMGQGKMMGKNQQHMMNQMGEMHGMMVQMMGQMQKHMNACPFAESTKKE